MTGSGSPLRAFIGLYRSSARRIAVSVAISIVQSLLLVPIAVLVRYIFDTLIPQGRAGALIGTGALILGLYLVSATIGILTKRYVLRTTKDVIARLRGDVLERVYSFPRAFFDRTDLGTLHSMIVQETERLDQMSTALVGTLLPAAVISIALAITLIAINAVLFGLLVAVMPLMVVLGRFLGRAARTRTRVWQREFDVFSTQTLLALRAMTLTKVNAAEREEVAERRPQVIRLAEAGREMTWAQNAYTQVQGAAAAMAGVIVMVVGGAAVARGSMSLGSLLSFFAIVALIRGQATLVLFQMPTIISGLEYVRRLMGVLDADHPPPYSGTQAIEFGGEIALDRVCFAYGEEPLLHEVSLTVEPGEWVALAGPNGAGKSTVASLVLGLYRPDSGRLLADGRPYDDLDLTMVRRRIGVVLQDPVIFPGSIADNIAYGTPGAAHEQIFHAARVAAAHEFIESFADGYDTPVGDEGVRLSSGQRQRVAIARALLREPRLLVFDEPTSHLDDSTAVQLMENLRELPGAPGLLLISHDPAIVGVADRVLRIRDGGLVTVEDLTAPRARA
jgi:ABC-type multidrug transport system fused ATPase/permease subunit